MSLSSILLALFLILYAVSTIGWATIPPVVLGISALAAAIAIIVA